MLKTFFKILQETAHLNSVALRGGFHTVPIHTGTNPPWQFGHLERVERQMISRSCSILADSHPNRISRRKSIER
jgi:hypothetical protein